MKLLLRYGSHSEKDYFEKMLKFFDGVTFASNLLESTPSATVSLIAKFSSDKYNVPYIIDPMTYSFGEFFDIKNGEISDDLSWLMSKTKKYGLDFKRSYRALGENLGGAFLESIQNKRSISLGDLQNEATRKDICKSTVNYQKNRIINILKKDEEYAQYAEEMSSPIHILAPYFFIQPGRENEWIDVIRGIAEESSKFEEDNLYIKLCFDKSLLDDNEKISLLGELRSLSKVKGFWIWASDFNETEASERQLSGMRSLVEALSSEGKEVFNRHGGYFSMMLTKLGLSGVSTAVGYGEQKDAMPVVGVATPVVNYYFPLLHKKMGIPDVQRSFYDLGINSSTDFFRLICGCAICRGVLSTGLVEFRQFGEKHLATEKSRRRTQTPAAAKRARFHYLLSKANEKKIVSESQLNDLIDRLKESQRVSNFDYYQLDYIDRWLKVID
ncbi:hypothetical protein M902_0729 [Bacteriovorax sp. BAL6_X]|uniref:hypothetical protein n=1 Tax=Bacteriovorax sp. BAL6_X TaxID=1201290 RepID=UPI0003865B1B|nr:hypothetical protein [Bacteriovorax sp. BAL6_X]EPZ49558.1 hypothetical protein M902_0729 [Bacteriovorax sp. BAL6_X]